MSPSFRRSHFLAPPTLRGSSHDRGPMCPHSWTSVHTRSFFSLPNTPTPTDGCVFHSPNPPQYPCADWPFLSGLSDTNSRVGICSGARYRIESDVEVFGCLTKMKLLKRFCRVLCHELGHLLQMKHCVYWNCLMQVGGHLLQRKHCVYWNCLMQVGRFLV